MDQPDNYYTILGVPMDADQDTVKRAYRQLARRFHPDLTGEDGAVQMKRVNRAYEVLSDPEKRLNYDTILGGNVDLRRGGLARARPVMRKFSAEEEEEFAGLSIFCTRGPLRAGAKIRSGLGVITTLTSVPMGDELLLAAGSLEGRGMCWQVAGETVSEARAFALEEGQTVESLRELRFSAGGRLLAGWGRLHLHVWEMSTGRLLWNHSLLQRAVSAHFSLDVVLREGENSAGEVWMALPLQPGDPLAPRVHGVRGSDVLAHPLAGPAGSLTPPLICLESELEKRAFWAIRLRALAPDLRTLLTLSCANVPDESEQMIVLRRWDLAGRSRFGKNPRPQISSAILAGSCANCTPPYAVTADLSKVAFVSAERNIRLHDTLLGTYSELASGSMGASSRLALSPDGVWLAVAREDSEINEGVIDLWSYQQGQIAQKLYHPWQISALHFSGRQLVVALTDGTVQIWQN